MLKSIIIVFYIIVIVIGIGEKIIFDGKEIRRRHIQFGQEYILRLSNNKGLIAVETKVFAKLKSQVRICISVSHNLEWFFNAYGTMVCGEDHFGICT